MSGRSRRSEATRQLLVRTIFLSSYSSLLSFSPHTHPLRMRLILNDPKNPNKDLVFVSSNIAPTDSVSREEVALVGLGHIMSDRPIGKVLGEPYKTQWEGIVEDRKRGNGVGGGNGGEKEEGGKKKGGGGGGGGNGGGTPPPRLYMQNR